MLKPDDRSSGVFSHSTFIPGIEGMRALAVLAVLLFHLDLPGVAGGYLGVDLFFVISGFIITRNILSDQSRGSFSLREFYIRRFRRLLPALVVTVLLTLAAALALVPPAELAAAAESAVYALFSLANFNFWLEAGYFDAAAESKPLLHTWSLSVEEQFYLFWPALLLLLATTQRRVIVGLLLLLLSVVASLLLRHDHPDAVFFLLPFRLHQLMAGALIAILSLRLSGYPGSVAAVLGGAGFLAVTMMPDGRYSPAVGAVLVTGCGALLLLGRDTGIVQALLGNRPMQWIGQRSYAIYLVHWPIVVLYKFANDFELGTADRLLLFVAAFIAAILLHEWVEKPFRKRGVDTTRAQRFAVPATCTLLAASVILAGAIWHLDGLSARGDALIQKVVDSVAEEKRLRNRTMRYGQCNLHTKHAFSDYDVELCATPVRDRKNVFVIGDSLASDVYIMLSSAWPEIHFLQATAGACTAVLRIDELGGRYSGCEKLNELRFARAADPDIDLVVLASVWGPDRIAPLVETVEYLHSMGKAVLVIGPRATFRVSLPLLLSQQSSLEEANQALRERVVKKDRLLALMRAALPGVKVLDMGGIQCSPHCDVIEGKQLLYYDRMHLTVLGSRRMGERLRESFDLLGFIEARPGGETR